MSNDWPIEIIFSASNRFPPISSSILALFAFLSESPKVENERGDQIYWIGWRVAATREQRICGHLHNLFSRLAGKSCYQNIIQPDIRSATKSSSW